MWLDKFPPKGYSFDELPDDWQHNINNHPNFEFSDGTFEVACFLEYVVSDIALRIWHHEHPDDVISLMDLLELWLWRGDGLEFCPTHESFLANAIRIIDDWQHQGRKYVGSSFIWQDDDGDPVAIPLVSDQDRQRGGHRLLNREVFLQLQSRKQAKDQRTLEAKIDQIAAHFKGDPPTT